MAKLVLEKNLVALNVDDLTGAAYFFVWVVAQQDLKHLEVIAETHNAKVENVVH